MKSNHHSTFGLLDPALALTFALAGAWLVPTSSATAQTVAYWRFEEGPADAQVLHGGMPDGAFFPGVTDSSGYGNALSVWAEVWAGFAYRTDVALATVPQTGEANNFSVQNTGGYPAMFTQTGSWMQFMSPAAFTIEVSFKPETGGWRTLVGRDSQGTFFPDPNLAALYLQITPQDAVAIKFCDVSGVWHEAISASGIITGFPATNSAAGQWYHLAAVSDGSVLSLYLNSGYGFFLVAQTDMTLSGSPNTALTAGTGDGADWDAGNWSVGRGLYNGGHADRAFGFIDEVRISDSALSPDQFLFAIYPPFIVDQPQSQLAVVGSDVTFFVAADGTHPLSYQWQTNSVNIPGATSPSYTALNVQLADSDTIFTVIVTNIAGWTPSAPAFLTVRNPQTFVVTTTNDSGAGSLRQAAWDYRPGDNGPITFAPELSGATIVLTSGQIELNHSLSIDGSALANGITIDGNANGRIFQVADTSTIVVLDSLTITHGTANGGGGIVNWGNLTLNRCTLTGNSATWGAGVYNVGTLTLNQSTLTGNSAGDWAGAVYSRGMLAVNQSTVTANTGAARAGGIGTELGGMSLHNSVVAGNIAPAQPEIDVGGGSFSPTGVNLTNGAPLLAPLGNYGGPTPTMPPLPGSPAINGCTNGTSFTTDQRGVGFPRVSGAYADIGAAESGNPIPSLVVNTALDENDGLGSNAISLRDAVAFAPSGSTIVFAPALSGATILLTNGQLEVSHSVTIAGPGPGALTVSGNHASRVFYVNGANVVMSGLTIADGYDWAGGGIYTASGVTMAVSNCTFSGNSANYGGGICNNGDSGSATLTISASTFSGNSGYNSGGAIYNNGYSGSATLTINASTISSNSATGGGGGIYNYGRSSATLTINASTLNNNSANYGSAIYSGNGGAGNTAVTVVNSTFSDNYSVHEDINIDGAWGGTATVKISASTFSRQSGYGIFNNGQGGGHATLEIGDTILDAGPGASANLSNLGGTVVTHGCNLSSDNGSGFLTNATDRVSTNPLLGPLQNNGGPTWTRALLAGSPAIDMGKRDAVTNLASHTDQRGLARPVDNPYLANFTTGDGSDIGAFEVQGTGGLDTDADGLPDFWELAWFGKCTYCETEDPDGDGQNNLLEYTTGLNPTDPTSQFKLRVETVPGQPAQRNLIFGPWAEGRIYTAQFTTNLAVSAFAPLGNIGGPTTNGTEITVRDLNASESQKFYRIRISLP